MPAADGKIRVLALDGGGVRALVTLEALALLESTTGKRVSDLFDIIAGTSTGGILALALSKATPFRARALSDIYKEYCPKIFGRSFGQKLGSLGQMTGPKYSNAALLKAVDDILGPDTTLGGGTTTCMVTTYDMCNRKPVYLSSWETPNVLRRDAAMSTTAAPTYFDPWGNYVDGGVCDNSPGLSAVIEACMIHECTVRDILCMSIGTGSDEQSYDSHKAKSWGLLNWVNPVLSFAMDGTSEKDQYHLQRLLPDANVLRMQCVVTGAQSSLDNADAHNLEVLQAIGETMAQRFKDRIASFGQRLGA